MLREEFDDWAVLFNPDTGRGFGLSPTGVFVWKLLDGEHTMDDLLGDILHHAESVPEDAGEHIKAFVDTLAAQGLAGFDRAEFDLGSGPEKYSSSSPGTSSQAVPFTYENPKLVDLGGARAAKGMNCTNTGSQNTATCNTGHIACTCSTGSGTVTNSCCYPSGCTPIYDDSCCGGSCDTIQPCCDGGSCASCYYIWPSCYSGTDGAGCGCGCSR